GDHDPSGIDMSRDIEERVRCFMENEGSKLEFKRVALNMDQIEQYSPPPNPAKSTDSRFQGYQDLHGDESWELDALEPSVIANLIEAEVNNVRNDDLFAESLQQQTNERAMLRKTSENWTSIVKFLEKKG